MVFESFRTNVVVRLTAFAVLCGIAIWGWVDTDWQVTPIVCALLALVVLIELIRYVESINRELSAFLEFVTHDDFSASFPIAQKGRVFNKLEFAYKRLLDKYRSMNEAREINHRYLESLVEHVSVAIICLDDKGQITLMNRQAKRLFRTPHLHDLHSLRRIDATLPGALSALGDGDRILVRPQIEGEALQLALYVTEFSLLDRSYKLISFQNIRDELEQREVDFSEKLITVLTHEIMNSVTPIIALSKVIEENLTEAAAAGPEAAALPAMNDLLRSVASIQSRGDGLLRFVQAYRSLTSLPQPNRQRVEIQSLLVQIETLLRPAAESAGATIETRVDTDTLAIEADAEQIQQVLINLVNNALEALDGRSDGQILLRAFRDEQNRPTIRVTDNGPGIDEDRIDNIFVPFFTTKQRGTGVGLSVSRQIMRLNHGQIAVKSEAGKGTEFSLQFR
jgi:signal transduction histidine kinase